MRKRRSLRSRRRAIGRLAAILMEQRAPVAGLRTRLVRRQHAAGHSSSGFSTEWGLINFANVARVAPMGAAALDCPPLQLRAVETGRAATSDSKKVASPSC